MVLNVPAITKLFEITEVGYFDEECVPQLAAEITKDLCCLHL